MNPQEIVIHPTAFIFVGIAIVGAVFAVHLRNIMRAIFSLMASILGIAVLFLYLGSPFVASMEVVIYVGGITVAMVFAIMFAYAVDAGSSKRRMPIAAAVISFVFFAAMASILMRADLSSTAAVLSGRDWSIEEIGRQLLSEYNLLFEALSVILLMAIAGAILIARREES